MDRRPEPQRRTMTLWEQLSTPDREIRDFLKVPHADDCGGGGRGDTDRRPCTLMDAIGRDSRGDTGAGTINWKPLRNRLRLRRAARACSTTTGNHRPDQEDRQENEAPATGSGSMSLMSLLEQADGQWDDDDGDEAEDGGASVSNTGAVVGEEEEDGDGLEEGQMMRACCVCMVRHKGAAFIPCGHTFCRPCSRELRLTRASCPLCNAFIHDVLHIF